MVSTNGHSSNAQPLNVAALDCREPASRLTNPALDAEGNIYVNVFRLARAEGAGFDFQDRHHYNVKPFLTE